jgi:hypothetical protein
MSNFQLTQTQVINRALRLCGVVDPEETASPNQLTTAQEALNTLVAAWENEGIPLWNVEKHTIPMVANQATYQISPDRPIEITNMVLHNSVSNSDITMVRLSREEYWLLGQKQSNGYPTQWYYEYGQNSGTIYLYPVPSTNIAPSLSIITYYQAPFTSTGSGTDIPDVPSEFFQALVWGLADQICHEYNLPPEKVDRIKKKAQEEKDLAFDMNVEHVSVYFNWSRYGGYQ